MTPLQYRTFTLAHDGLSHVLITDISISQAFNPISEKALPAKAYKGIWDTGATNSVISQRIVGECGLKPTGMVKVQHVGGESPSETYLVNILLPHQVGIPQIKVAKGSMGATADILIGMDIITMGDFAITNLNGKTVFSFRIPSIECIDFVKQHNQTTTTSSPLASNQIPAVGRNALCPCGSGKKYKYCHGK